MLSRENQITFKVGGSTRQRILVNWKAVNCLIDHHIHSFSSLFPEVDLLSGHDCRPYQRNVFNALKVV